MLTGVMAASGEEVTSAVAGVCEWRCVEGGWRIGAITLMVESSYPATQQLMGRPARPGLRT